LNVKLFGTYVGAFANISVTSDFYTFRCWCIQRFIALWNASN
jgi:hypothetical protein